MSTANDIILRPRFQLEFDRTHDELLQAFEVSKSTQKDFIVSRIDDHVFIRLPKHKQHFWSPQLHLEINETAHKTAKLYGLFGPNPTVWTMFMFFHFVVAALFIGSAVWAYTNYTLKVSYALQIGLMILLFVIWFTLYFIGRLGRASGKKEMSDLYTFMNSVITNS